LRLWVLLWKTWSKEREKALKIVVESLLPQVDQINVYLNGYKEIPEFLEHERITVARSQDHGDNGDAGKFFWAEHVQGYHFTCDDDLIYPPNYVSHMIHKIEGYGRQAVVSVHGAFIRKVVTTYLESRKVYHCLRKMPQDYSAHVLGTGAMAYHTSTIRLAPHHFHGPNMADIWVALQGQYQKVPFITVAHSATWLKLIKNSQARNIYDRAVRLAPSKCPQTKAVKERGTWVAWSPNPKKMTITAQVKDQVVRSRSSDINPDQVLERAIVLVKSHAKKGSVAVVGPRAKEIALAVGGAAKARTHDNIGTQSAYSTVVFVDCLWRLTDTEIKRSIASARLASRGGRGSVVLFEVTRLGNKAKTIDGYVLRAPIHFQRLFAGLGVRSQPRCGTIAYTMLVGRSR